MSIEMIKETALGLANSVKDAAANTASWAGRQIVWLKDAIVGLHLPSKAASGLQWIASQVQAGWQKTLPLFAAASAFLLTNNGIGLCAVALAGALYIGAERIAAAKDNTNVRLSLQVAALALAAFAGFAFGSPKQFIS